MIYHAAESSRYNRIHAFNALKKYTAYCLFSGMRQPATDRFKSIPNFPCHSREGGNPKKYPVLLIAAGAALNFTKNYNAENQAYNGRKI